MEEAEPKKPSIFVQYPGPAEHDNERDVLIYLRPESNGVLVESILLRAVENSKEYKKDFRLIYMANLPGDFVCYHRVVERYYSAQLQFAVHGVVLFSDYMRGQFKKHFHCEIDGEEVVGAFEALHILGMSPRELFSVWVEPENMLKVCGQTVKRILRDNGRPLYVINYNIPALLHCNNAETNLVVMLFRTTLDYSYFSEIVRGMNKELLSHELIGEGKPLNRLLHVSHGPFEEVLDALGYLYIDDGRSAKVEELSFPHYMQQRGIPPSTVEKLLFHPIARFKGTHKVKEYNIISISRGDSYAQSLRRLESIHSCHVMYPEHDVEALLRSMQAGNHAPLKNSSKSL